MGKVEFETARIAAAFGVEKTRGGFRAARDNFSVWQFLEGPVIVHGQWLDDFWLSIRVGVHSGKDREILMDTCCSWKDYDGQIRLGAPRHNELMARGLYRLGFEDEAVLSQLPELSAHEKLHLRQTMPREFWPQQWIDELENQ